VHDEQPRNPAGQRRTNAGQGVLLEQQRASGWPGQRSTQQLRVGLPHEHGRGRVEDKRAIADGARPDVGVAG